jgi:ABC-type Mn2+/Zn2+ transport system ATPase subunit
VSAPRPPAGASDGAPLVDVRGLALGYDGLPVLEDVTLTVREGERWFLLGPNGAGKTTLLRALLGLLPPRAGTIVLRPDLQSRQGLGFVPQRCELSRALPITVREFVLLGTVGLRVGRAERADRVRWALEHAGLGAMAGRAYHALSGGERQRVLVARALARRPALLVLDEPTSNLDPGAEDALMQLLAGLNRDDALTLLVVTHDVRLVARYASHVALVHERRVVAGPREAVLDRDRLAAVFGVGAGAPEPAS